MFFALNRQAKDTGVDHHLDEIALHTDLDSAMVRLRL